jgi:hypothetical protein
VSEIARRVVLFLDVDGTLCDSSSADHLLPSVSTHEAHGPWLEHLAKTNFDPMPGACKQVKALVHSLNPAAIVVITGRSELVRTHTRIWLDHHFPMLQGSDLSMRALRDDGPSHTSKINRLKSYRSIWQGSAICVVDDDPKMIEACEYEHDLFVPVGEWSMGQDWLTEQALKTSGSKR